MANSKAIDCPNAWYLTMTETNDYGTDVFLIRPVWADRTTLKPASCWAFETPNASLEALYYRGFLSSYDDNEPLFNLTTAGDRLDLPELERLVTVFRKTEKAIGKFHADMGHTTTIGQKCQAWARAFKMKGVLKRASFDDPDGGPAWFLHNNIATVIDFTIADWSKRARPLARLGTNVINHGSTIAVSNQTA